MQQYNTKKNTKIAYNANKKERRSWMVNIQKLKGKMVENGVSVEKMAEIIGVNRSTMYRKLDPNGKNISIKEATIMARELKMSFSEVNEIFFNSEVA